MSCMCAPRIQNARRAHHCPQIVVLKMFRGNGARLFIFMDPCSVNGLGFELENFFFMDLKIFEIGIFI